MIKTEFPEIKITIIRSERKTLSIELKVGEIIARAPQRMTDDEIYGFINSKKNWINKHLDALSKRQESLSETEPFSEEELKALAKKAAEIIPQRVRLYAEKIGVTYGRITIKAQKTRWGSCSSKGNLNFNCLLALLPIEIIDSVVVHELCHRKQMNHSPKFYEEIEKVFPDYKRCRKWLKENGSAYMARLVK